jgi:hypothetical protein
LNVKCFGLRTDEQMSKERRAALFAISKALIESGHTTLDGQARALGLPRSTAWTVIRGEHKLGRLSRRTIQKILASSRLPANVRKAVEAYAALDDRADAPRYDAVGN